MSISSGSTSLPGTDGRGPGDPAYEMILDGQVAMRWRDHVEWLGVLPEDWEGHEWDDDEQEVLVVTHEQMQDDT